MNKIMMIGNAHIDPVWLWQWQEGYQEIKATFRSALDRLDENEDFIFTCACADYYRWVEENDPEMFEQIRARVAQGRWVLAGGMWIQPDMNTPCGESVARHLMHAQRYFRSRFGKIASFGYNVDTFGHNAMLPQLLKKAGVENYVWMRPDKGENSDIPEGAMLWRGADGSEITAYRIYGAYPAYDHVTEKIGDTLAASDRLDEPLMCFYGVGNHGGGPTIENLKEIDAYIAQGEQKDRVCYASPQDYFAYIKEKGLNLPVWEGELQHHASGCYSTCSNSKYLHRKTENALLRMETLGVLSDRLTGHELKAPFVQQAWHDLLFNEFHDIMGGCSLKEAMKDAEMSFAEALSIAAREENAALQRISWRVDTMKGNPLRVRSKKDFALWGINGQGTPVVVFNPHAFEAKGEVCVRRPIRSVRDDNGNTVPCQTVRSSRTNGRDKWDGIFTAQVPALGWRLYWVFLEEGEAQQSELSASQTHIENEYIRARFDPLTGALMHLIDKRTGRDALLAPARARLMDIEHCDTWAHMVFKFDREAGAFSGARVDVLECGEVRAVVRVTTQFGLSRLEQKYILYRGSDQLDVQMTINLRENHRLLKLCFPTKYDRSIAQISYGAIERVPNGDEEHCQQWAAVEGADAGLAVLNDGRYSYSAQGGELRMTVANTSLYADHYGQRHRDDTCCFMDQDEMSMSYSLVPYEGAWQDAGIDRRAALLNRPLPYVVETYHEGALPGEYRGIEIDNACVDLCALKRAEDDEGFVLRLHETTGRAQRAGVKAGLLAREMELEFAPFEIKTVYVPADAAQPVREILLTEIEE